MRFSFLTALAALGAVATAQITSTVVVTNINTLTVKSQNLIEPAKQLSILNAPQLLLGLGPWPKVIFGFGDIVATATGYITAMGAAPKIKFWGTEATAIADAFRLFVKVHQQLLDIIIGKGGFLTQIPFVGPPIAAVLRSIEGVVDSIAFGIIDLVDDTVGAIMRTEYSGLQVKIGVAVKTYA
ncbi:hypothetical protein NEMBOFW57_008747 [Staphylotrichum longicolle]|uniref:Uncharacterized protein n=1 Tax=Staphylotrichum longicolle TaxID=669026 RepID=A0AAD4ERU3_9PEZI|nr:hypothetical protein NEMBOFW57_008747 [Staphylotrichum longicolle]